MSFFPAITESALGLFDFGEIFHKSGRMILFWILDRVTILGPFLASGVWSGKIEEQKLSIMDHRRDNPLYLVAAERVLQGV